MHYSETPDGKIQACWAFRIGQVCNQYFSASMNLSENDKFEATLATCLLNSLLCYTKELIDTLDESSISEIFLNQDIEIIHCTGNLGNTKARLIIDCLRNALSHPVENQKSNNNLKFTGFRSYNKLNAVDGFIFTHSPMIKNNGEIRNLRYKPFELKDRLKIRDNKFYLDDLELTTGPYLELKVSIEAIRRLIASLSELLSPTIGSTT